MNKLSYLSSKTIVKKSTIHGKGLFASEPILRDEIVAIKGGHIYDRKMLKEIAKELDSTEIQIEKDLFIGPLRTKQRKGSMLFLNHSCEPNVGIQGQIAFVAMRNIQPNEELTHDWATTDDDDYEMVCNCGVKNCRKIIIGQDWRKIELQKKYKGYIAWHILRKINKKN